MEKKEKRIIELRSLNRNKFSGLSTYSNTRGTVLGCQESRTGYKTGLTKEEETEYEKLLNLPEKTLSSRNADFWSVLETRIIGNKLSLDISNPMDYLRYKALLNDTKVCPSMLELSKYPEADFVIYDESEVAAKESIQIDYEMKASEAFSNLSGDAKIELLLIFGKRVDGTASDNKIKMALYKIMKDNPKLFIETIKDPNLKIKVMAEKLLANRIITRQNTFYKFGDEVLATSMGDLVDYLNSPKNSNMFLALKSRLEKVGK